MGNTGIYIGKGKCIVCVAGDKRKVHDVLRNSSGQPMPGKVPEAFEASFVVAVQPVANSVWVPNQDVDCLPHWDVSYANYAHRDHSGQNLMVLFFFAHFFQLFQFSIVHVLIVVVLICMFFGI